MGNLNQLRPAVGDKLVAGGGGKDTTAHAGRWMGDDWMWMAKGYARAAELAVAECSRSDRDFVLYPVVLLCRHSIELALKEALRVGHKVQGQKGPSRPPAGHKIWEYWQSLRPILDKQFANHPVEEMDAVQEIIREFHSLDPTGQTFRYPFDRKDKTNFDSDQCVCLVTFTLSSRKVLNFLDGCATAMAARLSQ